MSERQSFSPDSIFEPLAPSDGKIVEIDGKKYQFQKVPTGRMLRDAEGNQIPEHYSLKTWFSHTDDKLGPGPGWDSRLGIGILTDEAMQQRYGYVFTQEEVFSPGGILNPQLPAAWDTEDVPEFIGGMPDDIPYFELVALDE